MTYCLANRIDHGLVFVSDSGTNAGADQISAHSRMHRFGGNGERTFTLLSAGDLATTQGLVAAIRRAIRRNAKANLMNIEDLPAAAEHVGRTSIREQAKHRGARLDKEFLPAARSAAARPTSDRSARQATSCAATPLPANRRRRSEVRHADSGPHPRPATSLDEALKRILVPVDSTMRSNGAPVGPPVECLVQRADTFSQDACHLLEEYDTRLPSPRRTWSDSIRAAFDNLPSAIGTSDHAAKASLLKQQR